MMNILLAPHHTQILTIAGLNAITRCHITVATTTLKFDTHDSTRAVTIEYGATSISLVLEKQPLIIFRVESTEAQELLRSSHKGLFELTPDFEKYIYSRRRWDSGQFELSHSRYMLLLSNAANY